MVFQFVLSLTELSKIISCVFQSKNAKVMQRQSMEIGNKTELPQPNQSPIFIGLKHQDITKTLKLLRSLDIYESIAQLIIKTHQRCYFLLSVSVCIWLTCVNTACPQRLTGGLADIVCHYNLSSTSLSQCFYQWIYQPIIKTLSNFTSFYLYLYASGSLTSILFGHNDLKTVQADIMCYYYLWITLGKRQNMG